MHDLTTSLTDRMPLPATNADRQAASVAHLLEIALAKIDADRQGAKAIIAKARSLLRPDLDRSSAGFRQSLASGGLAAWRARQIARFIEEHIDEPIRVETLRKVVGLSLSHFSRSFRRTFGEPPRAYLIRRKVAHARHLMLVSDLPLIEVAQACGFADQAHFSRAFRKRTGQSPMVWRREQRDRQDRSGGGVSPQPHPADVRGAVRARLGFR